MNLDEVEVFYSREEIQKRVAELGKQISQDYTGEKLMVVGILKGAFIFMADLVRNINVSLEMDFMDISSYGAGTISSGEVKIIKDLSDSIEGKNVLIVEDIVDTGLTLHYVVEFLKKRNPNSIKIACLLDKPSRRTSPIKPDYVGYKIPDEFVVGYGLDYNEFYREYPDICILKPSIYKKAEV